MPRQDATTDYIEFLSKRGGITHVITAPPDAGQTTLSLTQVCLDCGIPFPVPLPDGSVAINVMGELPDTLTALDVAIRKVPAGTGDRDGASALIAPPVEPEPEQEDIANEAAGGGGLGGTDDTPDIQPDTDRDADDLAVNGADSGFAPAPDSQQSAPEKQIEVLDEPIVGESLIDPDPSERETDGERPERVGQNDHVHPKTAPANPDRMQELLDVLTDIEVRIDALAQEQTQLAARFDQFAAILDQMASKPVPRPDATEFNRSMARMTAAFAQAMRRIDDLFETLVAERGTQSDAGIGHSVSIGMAALVDALKGVQMTGSGAGAQALDDVLQMQGALSDQLAALLEIHKAASPPSIEEILLDLRHATAELVAGQTRMAETG